MVQCFLNKNTLLFCFALVVNVTEVFIMCIFSGDPDPCRELNCTEYKWCGEREGIHQCFPDKSSPEVTECSSRGKLIFGTTAKHNRAKQSPYIPLKEIFLNRVKRKHGLLSLQHSKLLTYIQALTFYTFTQSKNKSDKIV